MEMEYLVTDREMQGYDRYTIDEIGIPSLVLMERAALSVVNAIADRLNVHTKVLCVCGYGNNGGDGLCIARLLRDKNICVDVTVIGNGSHKSDEFLAQEHILQKYDVKCFHHVPQQEYDIIIDAIFGTGLSRDVLGEYATAIHDINEKKAYKVSVDIPSGIHATTGKVLGCAVKADACIALAFYKRGHFLYPGSDFCGKTFLADIGITKLSFDNTLPQMYTLNGPGVPMLPIRKKDGNKGTFGKVLLIAGSEYMAGAALLSARSAYKMGAGMVKLVIPEAIREIVQTRMPEALIDVYTSNEKITEQELMQIRKSVEWADAIAIGPGLSICKSGEILLDEIISRYDKMALIDADGINILSQNQKLFEALVLRGKASKNNEASEVILTPHMGELSRLLKQDIKTILEDETKSCLDAVHSTGCIMVAKSARTHVCQSEKQIFLNTKGNDKMATAGSGDVLAGIILALLGQGMNGFEAAQTGVYLHACAGDLAARKEKIAGLTASDIIDAISELE